MKQRSEYFDFLRGLSILMVIAIHTSAKPEFRGVANIVEILVRQVVGCPVPIFLAISGYFLGSKVLETKEQRLEFWKKQIPKVYVPALIWSLPLYALSLKRGHNPIIETTSLFGMGYSIYYFIALIIQCYLLLPLLQKINLPKWGGVIAGISIGCGVAIAWFGANTLPLTVYLGPCITWLMFFCLGVYLRKIDRNYNLGVLIACLIVSVGFMMAEAWALNNCGLGGYSLKPSIYIYSTIVILILFSNKAQFAYRDDILFNKIISYIGRISFGVYLTHCYWIMILGRFMGSQTWVVKWFVVSVISILSIMIARHILNDKVLKHIGFK